jgi:hypothetical protein
MRRQVYTLFWLESALAVAGFGLLAVRISWMRTGWQRVIYPTWQDTMLGVLLTAIMLALAVAGSAASERWAAWAFLKRWMLQVSPLLSEIPPEGDGAAIGSGWIWRGGVVSRRYPADCRCFAGFPAVRGRPCVAMGQRRYQDDTLLHAVWTAIGRVVLAHR